jgi:hypothetical protein
MDYVGLIVCGDCRLGDNARFIEPGGFATQSPPESAATAFQLYYSITRLVELIKGIINRMPNIALALALANIDS